MNSQSEGSPGAPTHHPYTAPGLLEPAQRHRLIAEVAYLRAQRRGFEPGGNLDDWLAAEAEVDAALAIGLPE
ncbi:MAG: DUF2934 domain-containing protein [Steroidobacteraceae bacterium]